MTASGRSKLYLYYYALAYEIEKPISEPDCDAADDGNIDRWRVTSPNSPVPVILAAKLLNARAWCHRGVGYVDSVTQGSWRPFQDDIEGAAILLEKNKVTASVDPEYYALLEDIYTSQGRSRADFDRLLDEASRRFPLYYEIYDSAVHYYQPQWYGSDGDIDRIARYAVEKTRSRDGTSGYFRVYWALIECKCYRYAALADWPTMRAALTDLAQHYPVDSSYIKAAQMACFRGEADDAKKYLSMLTVNDPAFWDKTHLALCRVLVGPEALPIP